MAPKKPAQKMSLGDFLQDSSLGNWADELEDMPVAPSVSAGRDQRDRYDTRSYGNDRREMSSFSRDQEGDGRIPRPLIPLPTQPPYTAHVGNLAFDLTETEIENYFQDCKVISVRVMKDKIDNRPKGFGYVEFADLESLKRALSLGDGQLAGRNVRVSVAEPPKSGSYGADEASQGEWRSGKVLPPMESRNRMGDREPRMNRNFSGDDSGRPERREMALASSEAGVDKWERRGPLPPPSDAPERRSRSGFPSRSGSASFATGPSRSPPRESAADTGEWRSSKAPAIVSRNDENTPPPTSPPLGGSPVMQRRKLALLPRSDRSQDSAPTPPPSATESKPKSNPFGAARPVDTDSALKKVEEKLAKDKEHQDESTSTSKGSVSANPQPTAPTAPRHEKGRAAQPKQLLRRTSANPASVPATKPSQTDDDDAGSTKVEAPAEPISETADKAWRKSDPSAVRASPAASEEDAGWETVPTRPKKVNGVAGKASK